MKNYDNKQAFILGVAVGMFLMALAMCVGGWIR